MDLTITSQQRYSTPSKRVNIKTRPLAEKYRAIELYRNGNSKAEIRRRLNLPESTLRGWVKEAVSQGILMPRSSSESSPCSPLSVVSGDNEVIDLSDSSEGNHLVIDLDDEENHKMKEFENQIRGGIQGWMPDSSTTDYTQDVTQIHRNWQKLSENENNNNSKFQAEPSILPPAYETKGYMGEAGKSSEDWVKLLAQSVHANYPLSQHQPITPTQKIRKRRQESKELNGALNISNDPLQFQQRNQYPGTNVVLNPNWQQMLQDNFIPSPNATSNLNQMQQPLFQQQINPAIDAVQKFQHFFMMAQMMQDSQNLHSSTPQLPKKRRRLSTKPKKVKELVKESLDNNLNNSLVGQEPVDQTAIPSPIAQDNQFLQFLTMAQTMQHSEDQQNLTPQPPKKRRRMSAKSKKLDAQVEQIVDISLNNSTVEQQIADQTATPSPSKQKNVKIKRKRRSKFESVPDPEFNEYFDTDYMLQDWLLLQQQAIGERIMIGYTSDNICLD